MRAARSAALVEVTVTADARDCLLVRIWFVRDSDTAAIAPDTVSPDPGPDETGESAVGFPYGESLEWRFTSGSMTAPGPASVWVRPRMGLLEGYAMSPLARAVLIADSASGVSAELSWHEWSFVNVDLDVHLARPLRGDWLLMEATTQLGAHGTALARSTLSDLAGPAGAGLQTLVLAPLGNARR